MKYFNDKQIKVLRDIIYKLESGNDYGCFISAYTNSSLETAITIGAGQWFANNARNLLKIILDKYSSVFRKLDTENIEADLKLDWTNYNLSKTSPKAKVIISIISSKEGIEVQNQVFQEQMELYAGQIYKQLGVTDSQALAMLCNFVHQGGFSAAVRIINKTKKPYNLDNVYNASKTDTGNQVGAYKERQKTIYEYLKNNFPCNIIYVNNKTTVVNTSSNTQGIHNKTEWTGIVIEDTIPRKYAGIGYDSLQSVKLITKNTKVGVCDTVRDDKGDNWYYISIDTVNGKKYGFIPSGIVEKEHNSSSSKVLNKTAEKLGIANITTKVHVWAGESYKQLNSKPVISKGQEIGICDTIADKDNKPWYYIKIGNYYGFVPATNITVQ
jgi:hypothetical protein